MRFVSVRVHSCVFVRIVAICYAGLWPSYLDDVPFSGIIRIRDMMYSVAEPVSPRSGRRQLRRARQRQDGDDARDRRQPHALRADHRHPALRELIAAKLRDDERHPDRRRRGRARHQRRHPRAVHHLPVAARSGRRGADSGSRRGRRPPATSSRRAASRSATRCTKSSGWRSISTSSSLEDHDRRRACSISTRRATRPAAC